MDYALCINGGVSPYVSSVLLSKKLDAVGQKNKKYVLLSKIFLSQF